MRTTGAKGLKETARSVGVTEWGTRWVFGDGGDLFAGAEVEAEVEAGVEGGLGLAVFRCGEGWASSVAGFEVAKLSKSKLVSESAIEFFGCEACIGVGCKLVGVEVGMLRPASACSSSARGCEVSSRVFSAKSGAEHGAGVFDEALEVCEGREGAGGEELVFDGAGDGVPGAHAGGEGHALQGFHGGFADAAWRGVDAAAEGDGVVRVLDELHVAEDVLDFGAVVEAEAADHVVLDLIAAQGFFDEA